MTSAGDLRGRDRRYEDNVPSSGWTEDSDCHCLLIDLPGFKKEEVKLQIDNLGHVVVSGERKVNENKFIRFRQSYDVPENSNIDETTGKFEDGILYVLIPKKMKTKNAEEPVSNNQQQQNKQNVTSPDEERFHDARTTMASSDAYKPLFIVTAVLAFSLGIIVSQMMQSKVD